ncbi:MAG: sugar phosphate isomerase/epimerase [Anaerolineae bacterium]|nr:sugar phosphate isomerase/epimerase [Anaerolineae bacterium]
MTMIHIACSTGIRSTKSLEEACRLIHELGFRFVDPLAMEGWHIKPSRILEDPAREAEGARELLNRYGLQCAALNLGFAHPFTRCSPTEHETNLQVVRGACLLARSLGTTVITVGTGGMGAEDRETVVERVSERLREVVAIAAEAGRTVALETHAGSIGVYPEAAREILSRCPGLKITYDPSHYIAEEIPIGETLDLLAHTAHVHLRNARVGHFQETMAKGLLDVPWVVDRILDAGYEGAVSIEYIEDCGAIAEGYEVRDEVLALREILAAKGLAL